MLKISKKYMVVCLFKNGDVFTKILSYWREFLTGTTLVIKFSSQPEISMRSRVLSAGNGYSVLT